MGAMKEVLLPDLGDFKEVGVIEVLIKPGDTVALEQSLITLETDKATMEIPSPYAGVVKEIKVKVGDKISQGKAIVVVEEADAIAAKKEAPQAAPPTKDATKPNQAAAVPPPVAPRGATAAVGIKKEVVVPDLGDVKEASIIEVLVKTGDSVTAEQSLITLETDKATMEIPSPVAGVVKNVLAKVGDLVGAGKAILIIEESVAAQPQVAATKNPEKAPAAPPVQAKTGTPVEINRATPELPVERTPPVPMEQPVNGAKAHASPSVRKFARELGVELAQVRGSGPKGRILIDDVQAWVKNLVARGPAQGGGGVGGLSLLPWPTVDFAKYGPIDIEPLSRIKKLSGANLARNWVMIPHVTNNDEADITDLDAFRVQLNKENEASGVKVTMLAFLIKACVMALKAHPQFNASLDGDNLVLKHYYNIGFAADTSNGLVVPVIKDADKKGILEVAKESANLARQAREGKLKPTDMQGGTFSISSLGGIGGTTFTPIINAPEVAILGVSKSVMKPIWDGKAFMPRLTLPLSLSYDHRVIDGATAARFNVLLVQTLADFRRAAL